MLNKPPHNPRGYECSQEDRTTKEERILSRCDPTNTDYSLSKTYKTRTDAACAEFLTHLMWVDVRIGLASNLTAHRGQERRRLVVAWEGQRYLPPS